MNDDSPGADQLQLPLLPPKTKRTAIAALTVLLLLPQAASAAVTLGIRVPVGANPAPPSVAVQGASLGTSRPCSAQGARWLRNIAQAVDALTVANARNRGSAPATWFASSKSWALNLAQYAAVDIATDVLFRHSSCTARATIYFGFGLSALNNAAQTGFPR